MCLQFSAYCYLYLQHTVAENETVSGLVCGCACGRDEAVLAPCFKHGHGHGVGQVQAALARQHGQAQALRGGKRFAQRGCQAAGFAAKDKVVTGLKLQAVRRLAAVGGHGKHA